MKYVYIVASIFMSLALSAYDSICLFMGGIPFFQTMLLNDLLSLAMAVMPAV